MPDVVVIGAGAAGSGGRWRATRQRFRPADDFWDQGRPAELAMRSLTTRSSAATRAGSD